MSQVAKRIFLVVIGVMFGQMGSAFASEALVIAASPSLAAPLDALGRAFEAIHPGVKVQFHYGSGLELRQTIATMQNRDGNKYFIGSGPFHVIAPSGEEFITRLEKAYYVLPESRTPYATASLVLAVPESLVDAPSSFEALAQDVRIRIAVADSKLTVLGQKTDDLLRAVGGAEAWKGRLDVATDARGVLDHLMNGKADVAIVFAPDAIRQRDRVRVVAAAPEKLDRPVTYSMAMERYCPNRSLCEEFLRFVRGADAEAIIKQLGYGLPTDGIKRVNGDLLHAERK
ncbi:MAG: molybdate ABC transporter substrate-binding protein [Nitrospirae bacterium]|nr:molybdate ABC transporter substrate-binding protein [Nitrospirota bacterium]MDE3041252.1 molybdate ABC transporter substrate-binding protein [Nitrospirota bacterium]